MKPILYKAEAQTRFSDLDPYGHVNFKHFLDFVVNSRLTFLEKRFQLDLGELAKRGIGFYATQAEIKFLRPIIGIKTLDIETFVESVQNEVTLFIPFTIKDAQTQKVYSEGKIQFTIIDMKTGRPGPITEEVKALFFE